MFAAFLRVAWRWEWLADHPQLLPKYSVEDYMPAAVEAVERTNLLPLTVFIDGSKGTKGRCVLTAVPVLSALAGI